MLPAVLGVMVPIIAIIMGVGIGMLRLWLVYRNKRDLFQMHHAERMAAIEKGIDLPPLPPQFFQDYQWWTGDPTRSLRNGLVLLFVGGAICAALYAVNDDDRTVAMWGLVPASIGVALLLYYALVGRKLGPQRSRPPGGQSGGELGFPGGDPAGDRSAGTLERAGKSPFGR